MTTPEYIRDQFKNTRKRLIFLTSLKEQFIKEGYGMSTIDDTGQLIKIPFHETEKNIMESITSFLNVVNFYDISKHYQIADLVLLIKKASSYLQELFNPFRQWANYQQDTDLGETINNEYIKNLKLADLSLINVENNLRNISDEKNYFDLTGKTTYLIYGLIAVSALGGGYLLLKKK